jgi:hypothetical protein
MTVEAADEGSFPDSSDNLETRERKLLTKQAEIWLRIDGLLHRMAEWFADLKTKMAHWSDENPPPDPEHSHDREFERFAGTIAAVAAREALRHARVEVRTHHHEGPPKNGNGDKTWKEKVILPLLALGVATAIATYAKVDSIQTHLQDLDRRVEKLEAKVFP